MAFQAEMPASASATFSSANSLASCCRLSPAASDTVAAMPFHWPGGVSVPVWSFQNRAITVWSAVRVVLVRLPSDSTWFSDAA